MMWISFVALAAGAKRGQRPHSEPLKNIESDFALDSSGFSTGQFMRWLDVKYGKEEDRRMWLKVHLMCGVKT
ncbi:MAG TPA: hypothetical protein VF290_18070, partial [Pyrinomonadaceae bacterium]